MPIISPSVLVVFLTVPLVAVLAKVVGRQLVLERLRRRHLPASGRSARVGRPVHAVAPTNPTRPAARTRIPGRPMPAINMIAPMTAQKIAAAFMRARGNRKACERR